MTPRTLSDARFTTGYPIVHYRLPMTDRALNWMMAGMLGGCLAALAFYGWSA